MVAALLTGAAVHLALLHVDTASPGGVSSGSVGWRNVFVVLSLPTLLALGARIAGADFAPSRGLLAAFVGLFLYALAASLWSPYPVAALEQCGYLWAYGALYLTYGALSGVWRRFPVIAAVWLAVTGIAVSCVQTLAFGNPYGSASQRLTSFVAPQAFALSLAVCLGLTLYAGRRRWLPSWAVAAAGACMLVAALANGGRQPFVAMVALTVVAAWPAAAGERFREWIAPAGAVAGAALLSAALQWTGPAPIRDLLAAHPALDLLLVTSSSLRETGDAGTLRDRLLISAAIARRVADSDVTAVVFGHGTSGAAVVIAEGDVRYRGYDRSTMDPNRTAHNEFLRALYEWGLPGLAMFGALIVTVVAWGERIFRRTRLRHDLLLRVTAWIAFVGFSLFGNTLAASSTPLGAAVALLLTEIDCRRRELAA